MNNLFQPFQSGFRIFCSTETAVTRVVNYLLLTIHSNASSLLMVLDLSAAFDTIDHSILLHHLKPYVGLKSSAFRWFWDLTLQIEHNLFSVKHQNTAKFWYPPRVKLWSTALCNLHLCFVLAILFSATELIIPLCGGSVVVVVHDFEQVIRFCHCGVVVS